MTGATPTYGLTYPTSTDQLKDAVSTIPHQLALDVESALTGLGGVAAPGAWQTPSLASGWADLAGGYELGKYRKVVALYLRGAIVRSGSGYTAGTTVFTLPVGYRPPRTIYYVGDVNGAHCPVAITAAGAVFFGANVSVGQSVWFTSPALWLD